MLAFVFEQTKSTIELMLCKDHQFLQPLNCCLITQQSNHIFFTESMTELHDLDDGASNGDEDDALRRQGRRCW